MAVARGIRAPWQVGSSRSGIDPVYPVLAGGFLFIVPLGKFPPPFFFLNKFP